MVPDLLCVPSMFQIAFGFWRASFPMFILLRIRSLIKLSVAPESTNTCRSALVCFVCKRVGILNDLYLQVNTLLTPSARAQTDGGTLFKNPFLRLQFSQLPVLAAEL